MRRRSTKIISIFLCLVLIFQQTGLAQIAAQLDIASYLSLMRSTFVQDKFRPLHLRFLQYIPQDNNFRLLLDKGDVKDQSPNFIEDTSKTLLTYFLIGLTLPNASFWVNLRPDSPENIIDPLVAQTELGKVFLEADLQLKKDTARMTSPALPEGKEYWDKLYKKAGELFGYDSVTIPTLTRPWIVPDEIIIRESLDSAYVYKATLKVMLEQDYIKDSAIYKFDDPRLKALNEYSSQLIRETIIPKLTKEINASKRYAPLRQVFYSLILAQWFKARQAGKDNSYAQRIDSKDLRNLTARNPYSVETYFNAYKENFAKGEYNIKEPAYTPYGQAIKSYFSGGISVNSPQLSTELALPLGSQGNKALFPGKSNIPPKNKLFSVVAAFALGVGVTLGADIGSSASAPSAKDAQKTDLPSELRKDATSAFVRLYRQALQGDESALAALNNVVEGKYSDIITSRIDLETAAELLAKIAIEYKKDMPLVLRLLEKYPNETLFVLGEAGVKKNAAAIDLLKQIATDKYPFLRKSHKRSAIDSLVQICIQNKDVILVKWLLVKLPARFSGIDYSSILDEINIKDSFDAVLRYCVENELLPLELRIYALGLSPGLVAKDLRVSLSRKLLDSARGVSTGEILSDAQPWSQESLKAYCLAVCFLMEENVGQEGLDRGAQINKLALRIAGSLLLTDGALGVANSGFGINPADVLKKFPRADEFFGMIAHELTHNISNHKEAVYASEEASRLSNEAANELIADLGAYAFYETLGWNDSMLHYRDALKGDIEGSKTGHSSARAFIEELFFVKDELRKHGKQGPSWLEIFQYALRHIDEYSNTYKAGEPYQEFDLLKKDLRIFLEKPTMKSSILPLNIPDAVTSRHIDRNAQLEDSIKKGKVYRVTRSGENISVLPEGDRDKQEELSEFDNGQRMSQAWVMEEEFRQKLMVLSDPAFIRGVLNADTQEARHFKDYSSDEQNALIATASRVPILIVSGSYLLHEQGTFAHARRGVSGLEPAIWIGEKTFSALSADKVALLLLEEAQHIVNPFWRHGQDGVRAKTIAHSRSFYYELFALALANQENPAAEFCETDMSVPIQPIYTVEKLEGYDDILIKELAKQRGITVDDLETDFQRTVSRIEESNRYQGFIDPGEDVVAGKIHEIFAQLIKVYQKKTSEPPGKLNVVDANAINAYVIRNRSDVYFFKGLYEALYDISRRTGMPLTEDILAFILAHELSHALQHTSSQGLSVRDFEDSKFGYVIQMMKNAEYDADTNALELMDKAGYSVFGAIDAMTLLEFITRSSQAENVLSSHPYVTFRKHRLSQVIFEQRTNVFSHVKAPRVLMPSSGRMKSRDLDFRYLSEKGQQDLLAMAFKAGDITALHEALGMFVVRRRMDGLKQFLQNDYMKKSFLRQLYMQVVLNIIFDTDAKYSPAGFVDYTNLEEAAAICEFGKVQPSTGSLQPEAKTFSFEAGKIEEFIEQHFNYKSGQGTLPLRESEVKKRDLCQSVLPKVKGVFNRLDQSDFKDFLLPPEEVKDLIALFKTGQVTAQLEALVKDPRRLVSAYLYAFYLGQEPNTEIDVPATDVKLKLKRRANDLYLRNPKYREVADKNSRRNLLDILLMQFCLSKAEVSAVPALGQVISSSLGFSETIKIPPTEMRRLIAQYFSLFSQKYPSPVASYLAAEMVSAYASILSEQAVFEEALGMACAVAGDGYEFSHEQFEQEVHKIFHKFPGPAEAEQAYMQEKIGEFIDNNRLIVFLRDAIERFSQSLPAGAKQDFESAVKDLRNIIVSGGWISSDINPKLSKIRKTLEQVVRIYSLEPKREVKASEIFRSETRLDYYLGDIRKVNSFKALLALPDWAVSQQISEDKGFVKTLIVRALDEGVPVTEVFDFISSRLGYDDRSRVFKVFINGGAGEYLLNFFKSKLGNKPEEISLWFMGMFSRQAAIFLLEEFSCNELYHSAKAISGQAEAAVYRDLAISLLEFVASQAVKGSNMEKESAGVYLELIAMRMESSGRMDEKEYLRNQVYQAMSVVSQAVPLEIVLSYPEEAANDGTPDFKTMKTNLIQAVPQGAYFNSSLSQHDFGWNWGKRHFRPLPIFVTYLSELSVDELISLLVQRGRYFAAHVELEYRGEKVSRQGLDDFFANLVTAILFKKMSDQQWGMNNSPLDRINEIAAGSMYVYEDKGRIRITSPRAEFRKGYLSSLHSIPYQQVEQKLTGKIPASASLDQEWERYVDRKNIYSSFPEMIPLLQDPISGSNELIFDPLRFLKEHRFGTKTSYRQIVKRFFMDSSAYSRIFNQYCRIQGRGYAWGKYRPLADRLAWVERVLPNKSVLRDSLIDLWETDIFPEIIADMPTLIKLAQQASGEKGEFRDMWSLLGELDDDVSRLKKLSGQIDLPRNRILELLSFYTAIVPLVLSPQKLARYGATCYTLWSQLPENRDFGLSEHLEALTQFMPEPSVLRDEMLMRIANKFIRQLPEAPLICEKLYSNNFLAHNKDLRSEDFVSETILHLFGAANTDERRDILLWVVGARDKPAFVEKTENDYSLDFSTLPEDVRLLPVSIREKFIEGFMLGDNGVLDPQNESEKAVMRDFLEQLFLYIFPKGTKGLGDEERELLAKVFIIVMKAYPPYRRVQVIKALAALRVRSDFEKTSTGERLSVLLGVLGPVGIKVAQYLSENETLVPDEDMRSSLGALRHKAPEITKISLCSVLENEVPLSHILVREIGDPAGIASIKQVNHGKWLDIGILAELLKSKAGHKETGEIESKMREYRDSGVISPETVAYLVEKARQYEIDLNEATVSVVFKIRRPNIETTLDIDYEALDAVSKELEGITFKGEALNISDLVETVKDWVNLEKNFKNEVTFHGELSKLDYSWAKGLAEEAGVRMGNPRIIYSSESLIVESEVQGIPILYLAQKQQAVAMEDVLDAGYSRQDAGAVLERLVALQPRQAHIILGLKKSGFAENDLEKISRKMLEFDYGKLRELLRHILLHQIFIDGVFHADLHQGNALLTPDGVLVMIDRGNVGKLNLNQREAAKELFKGLLLRDAGMIKQGIDKIFLNASYPEGETPLLPAISPSDIKTVLGKGYSLKQTMNVIGMRAVRGARHTPGGKDFSTCLKALTQAMYLFPTDMINGSDTLRAISAYVPMESREIQQAASEQAKYVVEEMAAKTKDNPTQAETISQIAKRKFYANTNKYFLHRLWQPILWRIIQARLEKLLSKFGKTRSINDFTALSGFARQVIEDRLDVLILMQNVRVVDVLKHVITDTEAERLMIRYLTDRIKGKPLNKFWGGLAKELFSGAVSVVHPVTSLLVESTQEWVDNGGKNYIEGMIAGMTVREAINLLVSLFPQEFADIKRSFGQDSADLVISSVASETNEPGPGMIGMGGAMPAEEVFGKHKGAKLGDIIEQDGRIFKVMDVESDGTPVVREIIDTMQSVRPPTAEVIMSKTVPQERPGGIDFRNLPIVTQAVSNLRSSLGRIPMNLLSQTSEIQGRVPDLDEEWQEIERLVNAGITPSAERIKEFLQASAMQSEVDIDASKVVSCIADIFRLEEERCCATEPVLRDILIVLESGRSNQELKAIFTTRS